MTIPVLVQLPLGLFGGLLLQYRDAQRARANISRGLRYYLPARIAAGLADARVDPSALKEQLFAACMGSDAQRFTSLAEGMAPDQLSCSWTAISRPCSGWSSIMAGWSPTWSGTA